MISKHIVVRGRVQGVSYRKYTRQKADELELSGNVKNLLDGSVEIYVSGKREVVQELEEWCMTGSPRSEVVEVSSSEIDTRFEGEFTIERLCFLQTSEIRCPLELKKYFDLLPDEDLNKVLDDSARAMDTLDNETMNIQKKILIDGWTINEHYQYIIDTERRLSALVVEINNGYHTPDVHKIISRESTRMDWSNDRHAAHQWVEFKALRRSTKLLFQSYTPRQFQTAGRYKDEDVSVGAIGFLIAGIQLYHMNMIQKAIHAYQESKHTQLV